MTNVQQTGSKLCGTKTEIHSENNKADVSLAQEF